MIMFLVLQERNKERTKTNDKRQQSKQMIVNSYHSLYKRGIIAHRLFQIKSLRHVPIFTKNILRYNQFEKE